MRVHWFYLIRVRNIYIFFFLLQGVHCDMLRSKCIFLGKKINFSSLNFFLKRWKIHDIYEHLKTFHDRQKFMSENVRTLGAWNRQFSSNGGRDFMQLCILRDIMK